MGVLKKNASVLDRLHHLFESLQEVVFEFIVRELDLQLKHAELSVFSRQAELHKQTGHPLLILNLSLTLALMSTHL